jgi:HAD superfamily hydrolase (TIGR01490 family)
MGQHLALFDFDGTLTRKDTLFDFARFAVGGGAYWARLAGLAPMLALHKAGLVGATAAKERFLARFFGGWPEERFRAAAASYCAGRLPAVLRPEAVRRLEWHQAQGHQVAIVSASAEDWVRPWASVRGVEVLATQLARDQGRLTGRLASPNCNGEEKVRRVRERFAVGDYATIYAYGDTQGDGPMLALAGQPFFRRFG